MNDTEKLAAIMRHVGCIYRLAVGGKISVECGTDAGAKETAIAFLGFIEEHLEEIHVVVPIDGYLPPA